MTEEEFVKKEQEYKIQLVKNSSVSIGDIYYSVKDIENTYEVYKIENYGISGLYWLIGNANNGELIIKKNSVLQDGSEYKEFFKSKLECLKQVKNNLHKEIENIDLQIKEIK